jgi:hypothetical protein
MEASDESSPPWKPVLKLSILHVGDIDRRPIPAILGFRVSFAQGLNARIATT